MGDLKKKRIVHDGDDKRLINDEEIQHTEQNIIDQLKTCMEKFHEIQITKTQGER